MARPTVSETTENLYRLLAGVLTRSDEEHGWPLLRLLSGFGDGPFGDLQTLYDRVEYVPPDRGGPRPQATSDLVDPATADAAWLDWLGQLVGVGFAPGTATQAKRDAIANAESGWQGGTEAAVESAVRAVLTGTKDVEVHDHTTTQGSEGAAGEWDVLIVTRPSETPAGVDVVQAVIDAHAKPAGVLLYHEAYTASWGTIEANFPTWSDLHAAGDWETIQAAQPVA